MRDARKVCVAWVSGVLIGTSALSVVALCAASTPTSTECTEAAEFIGNAARARDTGMARDAFLDQMESDFTAIRAFPNELRWFVHDAADEAFLFAAAQDVFESPQSPDVHALIFFRACMNRLMV
jgi:hypothetical protein